MLKITRPAAAGAFTSGVTATATQLQHRFSTKKSPQIHRTPTEAGIPPATGAGTTGATAQARCQWPRIRQVRPAVSGVSTSGARIRYQHPTTQRYLHRRKSRMHLIQPALLKLSVFLSWTKDITPQFRTMFRTARTFPFSHLIMLRIIHQLLLNRQTMFRTSLQNHRTITTSFRPSSPPIQTIKCTTTRNHQPLEALLQRFPQVRLLTPLRLLRLLSILHLHCSRRHFPPKNTSMEDPLVLPLTPSPPTLQLRVPPILTHLLSPSSSTQPS